MPDRYICGHSEHTTEVDLTPQVLAETAGLSLVNLPGPTAMPPVPSWRERLTADVQKWSPVGLLVGLYITVALAVGLRETLLREVISEDDWSTSQVTLLAATLWMTWLAARTAVRLFTGTPAAPVVPIGPDSLFLVRCPVAIGDEHHGVLFTPGLPTVTIGIDTIMRGAVASEFYKDLEAELSSEMLPSKSLTRAQEQAKYLLTSAGALFLVAAGGFIFLQPTEGSTASLTALIREYPLAYGLAAIALAWGFALAVLVGAASKPERVDNPNDLKETSELFARRVARAGQWVRSATLLVAAALLLGVAMPVGAAGERTTRLVVSSAEWVGPVEGLLTYNAVVRLVDPRSTDLVTVRIEGELPAADEDADRSPDWVELDSRVGIRANQTASDIALQAAFPVGSYRRVRIVGFVEGDSPLNFCVLGEENTLAEGVVSERICSISATPSSPRSPIAASVDWTDGGDNPGELIGIVTLRGFDVTQGLSHTVSLYALGGDAQERLLSRHTVSSEASGAIAWTGEVALQPRTDTALVVRLDGYRDQCDGAMAEAKCSSFAIPERWQPPGISYSYTFSQGRITGNASTIVGPSEQLNLGVWQQTSDGLQLLWQVAVGPNSRGEATAPFDVAIDGLMGYVILDAATEPIDDQGQRCMDEPALPEGCLVVALVD